MIDPIIYYYYALAVTGLNYSMNSADYIRERQLLWAARKGLSLFPASHKSGQNPRHSRTATVEDNLFETLSAEVRARFESADGGEFRGNGFAPKFHSVWSSAALAVNLFHYWQSRQELGPVCHACRIPSPGIKSLQFEEKLPIADAIDRDQFPKDPNVDVLIKYDSKSRTRLVGIECKFTEAYSGRPHAGLRPPYLNAKRLWSGLTKCRELAERISPDDTEFPHLHPAQLLKHILGLKHATGSTERFRLLYLWYDVPFDKGHDHRLEIERFAEIVRKDGINFEAMTYQELIVSLARNRKDHKAYIDYLVDRYL